MTSPHQQAQNLLSPNPPAKATPQSSPRPVPILEKTNKIFLCAVDGSEQSFDAVSHAISLMRKKKDCLVIVHIMKYPPWTSKEAIDALRKKGEEVLKSCSAKANEYKAKHTTHLIEAEDVRDEMIKLARFHGADYLVVGSRGLGKLGSVVLGSTSDYLAHHAPCPVILVRKKTLKDPY